ncbi:hypothetical protein [Sodalis sp. dw_96]|uniref:hypothetical protein n=1 Tax=Sodalis sp. dw_96 TaxID=2719794 RepID=UPI001BD371E4|nr:hypothetical protein [Sodalis sp. dw_96]
MTSLISSRTCNCETTHDYLCDVSKSGCGDVGGGITSVENSDLIFTGCFVGSSNRSPGSNVQGKMDNPRTVSLDMRGKIPIFSVVTPRAGAGSADWQSATSKCIPANAPVNIVKTDPAVKNPNKPTSAKIKIIIKKIMEVLPVSFVIVTTVVLTGIAVAGTLGLSFPPLILASVVVYVLWVLWRTCNADKKDWGAILIGSWASNKVRSVQNVAAGFIAGISAKLNGADSTAMWFAIKFSFYKSRSAKNEGCAETNMACANAAGVSVAKVQTLARQKDIEVTKAGCAGAMAGANVGTKINGVIEGSSIIGDMAGTGAVYGAIFGRGVDRMAEKGTGIATAAVDAYWRFLLPDIFPAQPQEESSAWGNDGLSCSADLSKHDESCVTGIVNAYWRIWLNDAVVPASSQGRGTVHYNGESKEQSWFGKNNKLWKEGRESSPDNHVDIGIGSVMSNAQRSRQVKNGTAMDDVNPGLGEWFGAYTGGIASGLYAGLDNRSGGRFKHAASAIGKQVSAVRNFMGTGTVVPRRVNAVFPEID